MIWRPSSASPLSTDQDRAFLKFGSSLSARSWSGTPPWPSSLRLVDLATSRECVAWRRSMSPAPMSSSLSAASSRIVSSMRKRSPPTLFRRLASTSASIPSSDASATSSAALREKVPAKTERRANNSRSSRGSKSWLHSIAARRVRCLAGASRRPPVRTGNRCSSRRSRASDPRDRKRGAASSIARGSPSRRAQISRAASSGSKSDRTARARSVSRSTASSAGSGSTTYSCSPSSRSGARLVASTFAFGAAMRSSPMLGAASRTCSKLSTTRSARRSRRSFTSRIPTAPVIVGSTSSGWATSRERDEEDAAGEVLEQLGSDLKSEARLATTPRAGQSD